MIFAGGIAFTIAVWLFGFVCGARGMQLYIKQQLAKIILEAEQRDALADLDGRKKVDEVV